MLLPSTLSVPLNPTSGLCIPEAANCPLPTAIVRFVLRSHVGPKLKYIAPLVSLITFSVKGIAEPPKPVPGAIFPDQLPTMVCGGGGGGGGVLGVLVVVVCCGGLDVAPQPANTKVTVTIKTVRIRDVATSSPLFSD